MLDRENFTRNIAADRSRIEFWRKRPTVFKVFTSSEYRTLLSFLRPHWATLLFLGLVSIGLAALEGAKALSLIGVIKGFAGSDAEISRMMSFQIMGQSYDLGKILPLQNRLGLIFFTIMLLLAFTVSAGAVKLLNTWLSKRVQLRIMQNIRERCLNKMFSFDLDYFSQARSGELIFLMNAETSRFSSIVVFASNLLNYGVQLIAFASMLFYLYWDLTLVAITGSVVFFLIHLRVDASHKQKSWESNLCQNRLSHFFHQVVYGIKMIKIGSLEGREKERYLEEHEVFERAESKMAVLNGLSSMAQEVAVALIFVAIMAFVYFFRSADVLLSRPDQILAYLFLLIRTTPSAVGLQQARSAMIGAYGPLARVMELLNREDGPDRAAEMKAQKPLREVTNLSAREITFSYNGSEPMLKDVSINFRSGSLSALVGFSGSGKSTLMDILSFVRHPSRGVVSVESGENQPLQGGATKQLVGYMNQEPIIFHDTIRSNVTYFRPEATEDRIWKALSLAAADGFVKKLPQGVDSGVGERGLTLSGGERQRIGLARVLLQDNPILLLDEVTNALDYETEKRIYDNLRQMKDGRIIIVAAHRLRSIMDFDQIIVMNQGRVVESGTHPELMARRSLYSHLFSIQDSQGPL